MQQHREPGGALDQRPDRGAAQANDEIAFPVSGHGQVLGLSGPLTDHHFFGDKLLPASPGPGLGHPQRTAVRRQDVNSRRSAPRPWMYRAW